MKSEGKQLKSALDLAMERMAQKEGQLVALSDEQKKAIAEIASKTKAKIAETEILYHDRLAKARAGNDTEQVKKLESELTAEIKRLRAREADERERVRNSSG